MKEKSKAPALEKIALQTAIEGHRQAPDTKAGERYGKGKPGDFLDTLLNIAATLGVNIGRVEYGEAAVPCKIHGGRIVSIGFTTLENQIQKAVQA
jgi:hypothetical protein